MKKFAAVAAVLILWPVALCLGGEAAPARTAADWANDPDGSLKTVLAASNALIQYVSSMTAGMSWAHWALTGLATVVAIARFIPAAQPWVDLAWSFVAGSQAREADKNKEVMAKGFIDVATIMRGFHPDTRFGEVLEKLESRLPHDVTAAYRAWEAEQEKNGNTRPPTPAAAGVDLLQQLVSAINNQAPVTRSSVALEPMDLPMPGRPGGPAPGRPSPGA